MMHLKFLVMPQDGNRTVHHGRLRIVRACVSNLRSVFEWKVSCMKQAVFLLQPKYLLAHPENYLFSLYEKTFLDESIQNMSYFISQKKCTGNKSSGCWWLINL